MVKRAIQCSVLVFLLCYEYTNATPKRKPWNKKLAARQNLEDYSGKKTLQFVINEESKTGDYGGQAERFDNSADIDSDQEKRPIDLDSEGDGNADKSMNPPGNETENLQPLKMLVFTDAEVKKYKLWPNGFIPYYIDVHSFSDKVLRDKIRYFLNSVNKLSSLNFVELPTPPSDKSRWVMFMNRRGLLGCADHSVRNFTNEGIQQVVLGYHCMITDGELDEAVLAIAGVPAQHNAPNRDKYVKVIQENILPDKRYLYEKLKDGEWLFKNLDYDFKSAGHFGSYRHSIDGHATMVPTKSSADFAYDRKNELTALDVLKINMLYSNMAITRKLQERDCHKLFKPVQKNKLSGDDPINDDEDNIFKPNNNTSENSTDQNSIKNDKVLDQDESTNDSIRMIKQYKPQNYHLAIDPITYLSDIISEDES